ncbi:hypothetical protein ACFXGI_12415 [Streptomyces sp. NPDC059355]|uniref:hypothetical protein n=1 Tax=Streptomyces sp. NPDC059355 TaxID=3346811 RepID=UPI003691EC72
MGLHHHRRRRQLTPETWSSGSSIRHDYTKDGSSDMADWYDFGDGSDGMHTFAPASDGTFQTPKGAWASSLSTYQSNTYGNLL